MVSDNLTVLLLLSWLGPDDEKPLTLLTIVILLVMIRCYEP